VTTIDYGAGATLDEAYAACTSALQALQRLGQSAVAQPLLAEAADEIAAVSSPIQADTSRSDSYKLTTQARLYSSVITALAGKLTDTASTAGAQDASDAANVFGIKGLPGDAASLSISRRDAGDRVANITDPIQRQQLLESAARTGDDTLSRAIVASAMDFNDSDTVNQFMSLYPSLSPAAERLWDAAHRKSNAVDLSAAWQLAALKPTQLSSLQNYEIASAAAGNTSAGSWNV